LALVILLTVDLTSTIPTACAGATTVHSVLELQLTDLLAVVPNSTFVAVLPTANPVPVMVALVPPAFEAAVVEVLDSFGV
jgi:hypothetical protein